ncbi:MAG: MFS transporter [Firmicutes bacterium]|nr:MFS transporter [Bacillota bacterium]
MISISIVLRLLYFAFYGSGVMVSSFRNLYFQQQGLTAMHIGLIAALEPAVMLISQPYWGMTSDSYGRRRTLMMLIAISAFLTLGYLSPVNVWILAGLALVLSFFRSPTGPILDSIVLDHLDESGGRFARFRLWGAVGWSLMALVVGQITERYGMQSAFVSASIGLSFVYLLLRRYIPPGEPNHFQDKASVGFRALLSNKVLVKFLFMAFMLQLSAASIPSMLPLYLKHLGASHTTIGLAFTIEGISEIPFFLVADRIIAAWGIKPLLVTAIFAYSIRMVLYSFATTPLLALLPQMLHGACWAFFITATVNYINHQVPANLRSTGQTMFSAVFWGLGASAGNALGGVIFERLGPATMYRYQGLFALGVALYAILVLPGPKTESLGEGIDTTT